MKKNLYFTTVFTRNAMENKTINILLQLLELPKVIILPFMRNDMGERYFSLLLAIFMAGVLYYMTPVLERMGLYKGAHMYTFITIYLLVSVARYIEIRQAPSVFDFAKFSYSNGRCWGFFKKIKFKGEPVSNRTIDSFLEPLFVFIIGIILLSALRSPVGLLLAFCAVCYSVSNILSARLGDHFIMDRIDTIICNEELSESFARGREITPRGVQIYNKRPSNDELRNNVAKLFNEDDDYEDAAVLA